MRILFLPLICTAFLTLACGSNKVNPPAKPKPDPKPNPPQDQRGCPNGTFQNIHTVALTFARGYPEKIGIRLDGEKELRLNECKQLAQNGVIASISREAHSTLVVKIDHNGFYFANGASTLPKDQGFEVVDLHQCNGAEGTTFYKMPKALPLDWKISYPNGISCPSQAVGEATGTVADVEAIARGYEEAR